MSTEQDEMKPPAEETPKEEPKKEYPSWEYREEFRIVGEMRKVINLAVDATEHEIVRLRRKLDKLTYGS